MRDLKAGAIVSTGRPLGCAKRPPDFCDQRFDRFWDRERGTGCPENVRTPPRVLCNARQLYYMLTWVIIFVPHMWMPLRSHFCGQHDYKWAPRILSHRYHGCVLWKALGTHSWATLLALCFKTSQRTVEESARDDGDSQRFDLRWTH